jgi:hypothetical protein
MVTIQTAHDKVGSQNGNSRKHDLRSQNDYSVKLRKLFSRYSYEVCSVVAIF